MSANCTPSGGSEHAIASRGRLVAKGDWVCRWEDHVDRAFMAKYALPADATSLPSEAE